MFSFALTEDAGHDLEEIESYVLSYEDAEFVDDLSDSFAQTFENLCDNPYIHPIYQFEPPTPSLHEYRSVNVYNYKVFYWVNERRSLVTIYRIRHVASDFTSQSF